MVLQTKAASETRLHHHKSTSLLVPIEILSSKNSDNVSKYRSGNNASSRKIIYHNSIESIDDNYQRISKNNLINTHFPIANIQQDSTMMNKTSASQLPSVPKQAGTFIHRFVNKFFSITNTNQNQKQFSRTKRIKRKQTNTSLNTRINHTPLKQQQRLKITTNKNKHCSVCRKYRNCFSILPMNKIQPLPTDSLDYTSESPRIINTNATTTRKNHSDLNSTPSISLPTMHLQKIRMLNQSQCQTIASAVELIFDTMISNYQQI